MQDIFCTQPTFTFARRGRAPKTRISRSGNICFIATVNMASMPLEPHQCVEYLHKNIRMRGKRSKTKIA